MRSRGRVANLLVSLRYDGAPPAAGATLRADGKSVGEVTSVAEGVALGFVKTAHAEGGVRLDADGVALEVAPSTSSER